METARKLRRYLAIQETYRYIIVSSGDMARGLSMGYIKGEIARLMPEESPRTIQRALSHKPITEEQIGRVG